MQLLLYFYTFDLRGVINLTRITYRRFFARKKPDVVNTHL